MFFLAQFFQLCVNLTFLFIYMRVVRSEYIGRNTYIVQFCFQRHCKIYLQRVVSAYKEGELN